MLLVCETPTHLFAELLGAERMPTPLSVVQKEFQSIDSIIGAIGTISGAKRHTGFHDSGGARFRI